MAAQRNDVYCAAWDFPNLYYHPKNVVRASPSHGASIFLKSPLKFPMVAQLFPHKLLREIMSVMMSLYQPCEVDWRIQMDESHVIS